MRVNITSENSGLSRKIRALLPGLIAVLMVIFVPGPGFSKDRILSPVIQINELASIAKNELVLLDTRSSWKFLLSHIPGARRIDRWQNFTTRVNGAAGILIEDKKFLAGKLGELGIDYSKTIVIYGAAIDKWRTDGRFFWMFKYLGFKKVAILEGGIDKWKRNNMQVDRGTADDFSGAELSPDEIKFDRSVHADQTWISKRLGSKSIALIDTRAKSEYEGDTPYGSPRGGHIPGAIHLDWRDFFTDKGALKKTSTLKSILNKSGINPQQETVVYCTGGVRSGMSFLVLQRLGYKVRNYDGSWWDWSRNPSLPVEN